MDTTTDHTDPDVTAAYATADQRLRAVLAQVGDWDAASPCEGWAARDVVDHLVTTQRQLLAPHVDLGDAPPPTDPAAAWAAHADRVREALAEPSVAGTVYDGFFGPTTLGETLLTFYVFDMLVHRWDVARAAGVEATFTEVELDLIDRSSAAMGESLRMEGICGPAVEVPDDADRATRMLGHLGRVA